MPGGYPFARSDFRCGVFDGALAQLLAAACYETGSEIDPMRTLVDRQGPQGFPQVFLLDPDRDTVEINAAALIRNDPRKGLRLPRAKAQAS